MVQIGNPWAQRLPITLFPPTSVFISLTFEIILDFLWGLLIINSTGIYKPVVICFDFIISFHELQISLKSTFLKVQERKGSWWEVRGNERAGNLALPSSVRVNKKLSTWRDLKLRVAPALSPRLPSWVGRQSHLSLLDAIQKGEPWIARINTLKFCTDLEPENWWSSIDIVSDQLCDFKYSSEPIWHLISKMLK